MRLAQDQKNGALNKPYTILIYITSLYYTIYTDRSMSSGWKMVDEDNELINIFINDAHYAFYH